MSPHDTCTQLRRKLVRKGTLCDGAFMEMSREWVTEPCGTPLFENTQRETGICSSCARGEGCEGNYPIEKGGR